MEETPKQAAPKGKGPQVPVLIKEPSPEPGSRKASADVSGTPVFGSFGSRRGSYVDIPSPGGSRRGSIIIADEVGCLRAGPGFRSQNFVPFYVMFVLW